MYSRFFWIKRFLFQALVWSVALMFGFGLLFALWYPASRWLFVDGWHWMPMKKWIAGVFSATAIGPWAGGLCTLYEWMCHVESSFIKKIVVGVSVISFLIYVCFFMIPSLIHYSVDRFF